jgi:hypothetical protein
MFGRIKVGLAENRRETYERYIDYSGVLLIFSLLFMFPKQIISTSHAETVHSYQIKQESSSSRDK